MEIAQSQAVTGGTAGSTSPANGHASSGTAINSDFETFLQMLTVQMRNQDPLNPADPTEFATQLATFSSVEQQVRTNELLTVLGAQMGALSAAGISDWIGMDARAEMPVNFDGSPVTIVANGSSLAEKAELVVRNSQGDIVQRLPIDTTRQELEWAGLTGTGEPLPAGRYDLSVAYSAKGELLATGPVAVQGRIVEVRNDDGAPVLVMDTGQEIEASNITGLRAPA